MTSRQVVQGRAVISEDNLFMKAALLGVVRPAVGVAYEQDSRARKDSSDRKDRVLSAVKMPTIGNRPVILAAWSEWQLTVKRG